MPIGTGTLYVQHKVEEEEEEEEESPSKKRKQKKKESVLDKALRALSNQQQAGSPLLQMENASLNVTQRQESLVVQYLAMGGHRHFSTESANRSPQLACSAVHSGPGQLCFGSNHTQKADLILTFEKQNCHSPALILIHNYHEARVHYRGHLTSCPKFVSSKGEGGATFVPSPNQDFWLEMGVEEEDCCFGSRAEMEGQSIKMDLDTAKHDLFKQGLARAWSGVAPQNVIFEYSTSTACHFFHGGPIKSCLGGGPDACPPLTSIAEILESEFLSGARHLSETELQKNRCRIFVNPPSRFRDSDLLLSSESLAKAIKERTEFGFVTIRGGREARTIESNKQEARDHFGFCVQSYACNRESDISDYTKAQVAKTYNWDLTTPEGKLLLKQYIEKQPPRTLNSGTFHCEETLSTSYLSWLMNERDFCDFEITHFLRYKFVNYWNSYLEPLLAARHEHKKKGNDTASTLNKLFQNSHYGRLGMESSNYDTAYLTTGENLSSKRKKSLGHLSTKHIVNLGLVRIKVRGDKKKGKTENRPLRRLPTSCEFITSEAAESEGEEEEEEEEDNLEFNPRFVAKTKQREKAQLEKEKEIIQSFSDSDWDSSDNDDDDDDPGQHNFVDLEEQLILDREEGDPGSKPKAVRTGNRSKYRIHFLYLITFSGKERPILNNIAGAVAVLSNSKKLFLGHINTMLECGDPKLCELCYIDTDSCIFSMTYSSWEDCVKPDKWCLWNSSRVMADEDGESSFHGQLKCEGIYKGGLFKTMKIYRLFDPQGKTPYYSRCKGVSRHMSNKLPLESFDSSLTDSLVVTRNSLRPTPAGQIVVTRESRKLAVAFNFKRKVDSSGIHSFPVSFVAEC